MAITFRHDAAAVAIPSTNAANRKYGQDLVMQQQQQKYQAQQADQNRMFELSQKQQPWRDNWQWDANAPQQGARQGRQAAGGIIPVGGQRGAFPLTTTADAQRQQEEEAKRQREWMEEARKQSGQFIMDSIENGEYDAVTARELRQNLIDEAEALGNPNLDATQRAEALSKIRARRATLSANRQPKEPPPSAQDEFNQGIVVDPDTGMRYRKNAKGDYEPLPQPAQEPQRPKSADEAFKADPKERDKYIAEAKEMVVERDEFGEELPPTPESRRKAVELAKQLWEEDNRQPVGPTADWSGGAVASAENPWGGSPVEPPPAPASADWSANAVAAPGTEAAVREMTGMGYELQTPAGGQPFYYRDDRPPAESQPPVATQPPAEAPPPAAPAAPEAMPAPQQQRPRMPLEASQNPWAEVASGGEAQAAPPQPAPPQPTAPTGTAGSTPAAETTATAPSAPVDFDALFASADSVEDRAFVKQMRDAAKGKSPEVQAAIGVMFSNDATAADIVSAKQYLKENGIDIDKLMAPPKLPESKRNM
jgi:hypothetical protein